MSSLGLDDAHTRRAPRGTGLHGRTRIRACAPGLWLALALAACGPTTSKRAVETTPAGRVAADTSVRGVPRAPAPLTELAVETSAHPLAPLLRTLGIELRPEGTKVGSVERAAPEIADLASARNALRDGFYAEVLAATSPAGNLPPSTATRLLHAEALSSTGQREDAFEEAQRLLSAERDEALKLEAAALMARLALALGKVEALPDIFSVAGKLPRAHGIDGGRISPTRSPWTHAIASLWLSRGHWAALRGDTREAERAFMRLIEAYNSEAITLDNGPALAQVAEAAMSLQSPHDANDAFREAVRAAPHDAEIKHAWASLFLEKFDYQNALSTVQEGLARNPNHAGLLVALGEILMAEAGDFAAASALVERAEQIHPGFDPGQRLLAKIALRDMDLAAARDALARAQEANARHPETLSLLAAERFLADDTRGFERLVQETLKRTPTYARLFTDVAFFAEWAHRYPEMVKLAERAIAADPRWAAGHATLGFNLLRLGDEARALPALQQAWRLDRFNVRVFHLLNLYDEVIPSEYQRLEPQRLAGLPVRFRFHRREQAVFSHYVPPLVDRALRQMGERYAFSPEGPLSIELFATNEHFSIRTAGVPNLGVQGVCFGSVVTATSPTAGPTNWAQVLWHELSHVFHIQLSKNRVPRWFTEGLAEYESLVENPLWRREYDHHLQQWLKHNTLPPVEDLNRAFTHARSPADIGMAYYASAKLVASWVERFGMDKMRALLVGWGEGTDTETLLPKVLGQPMSALDAAFRATLDDSLEAQRRQLPLEPTEADARSSDCGRRALFALQQGDHQQASAEAQACLRTQAGSAATKPAPLALAHYVLGVTRKNDAPGESLRHLETSADLQPAYDTWMRIGAAYFGQSRWSEARKALERAAALDPMRTDAYRGLRRVADETGEKEAKVTALRALAHLEQHDAALWLDYVGALSALERHEEVRREAHNLIGVAPHDTRTHRLLSKSYAALGDAKEAAAETALGEALETPSE